MSEIGAKMHQIRFALGLRHRLRLRSLQSFPRPQLYFRGLLLSEGKTEMEEREKKTKVKGTEGRRGGGKDLAHPKILAWRSYARPLAGFKGARGVHRHPRRRKMRHRNPRGGQKYGSWGTKLKFGQ